MFSIQAQYSYTIVETLMAHLDENAKSSPTTRTNIAGVLSKIIAIAAGESVGKNNSIILILFDSLFPNFNSQVRQFLKLLIHYLVT